MHQCEPIELVLRIVERALRLVNVRLAEFICVLARCTDRHLVDLLALGPLVCGFGVLGVSVLGEPLNVTVTIAEVVDLWSQRGVPVHSGIVLQMLMPIEEDIKVMSVYLWQEVVYNRLIILIMNSKHRMVHARGFPSYVRSVLQPRHLFLNPVRLLIALLDEIS